MECACKWVSRRPAPVLRPGDRDSVNLEDGFLAALIGLMGLAPKTPDHTSCTWALMVMDTLSLRRSPTALRGLPHSRTHRC